MKIAVTSSNGIHIDTHFGKATRIYIFQIQNNQVRFLEKRETDKYASNNPKHAFRKEAFLKVYETIKDCSVLYTREIGQVPAQRCETLGITVKRSEGEISRVLYSGIGNL